jgi:hypothetical protein
MNKATVQLLIAAVCLCPDIALSQVSIPSAPAPLSVDGKFRLYLQQAYSLPSVLVPAAFAGLDQGRDSPKEWGQSSRGYLNRWGTQRGQFQIGAFCAFGADTVFHEDPRFFPSGKHGFWLRTAYVAINTVTARSDRGTRMPAFGNYAAAIGGGFFPSAWLPPSASSLDDSLKRSAAILGMNAGINMGIEFGTDNRRFFHNKLLRPFHRGGKAVKD